MVNPSALNMKDLIKDKFLIWFYVILIVIFGLLYYFGEERTRKFEEEGFTLCPYKSLEVWQKQCERQMTVIEKVRGEFK